MPMRPGETSSERGAALIAALLLVALMAAIAVQLTDLSRFAVFRTSNTQTRADAYWYALGARELAEDVVLQSVNGDVMRSDLPWLGEAQVFPIADGLIVGAVRDGNNCLNLNALTGPGPSGTELGSASGQADRVQAMYRELMEQIEAPPGVANRLQAQIIDWIDTNNRPEPGGAEDDTYQRYSPPYRAANQPMVELEELLALPAMTPQFYAVLRPWLCVRPSAMQPAINVNTLTLEQAPLLVAALDGRISRPDAEALLFRRPPQGYDALQDFWADPIIAQLELDASNLQGIGVTSQWFEMDLQVRLRETRFELSQLVHLRDGGALNRYRQRFGPAS